LNAYLFNGGTRPKIYAPAAFSLGSSLLHLDESTYPAGSINELMTPFSGTADAIHDPGPITIGILMDIGWVINYNVGISQVNSNQPDLVLYPDPAHEFINVSGIEFRNGITYTISDFMGKEVMTGNTTQIDVSSLTPGIYFLSIKDGKYYLANKFIKD
jgi:hypothetical protein